MKKNQLKRELGRIRPREELVNSTIAKVNAQKEREERKIFSPIFLKGMKLAGALCAFVLVFCIGFAVASQPNVADPAKRTIGDLEATEAATSGISTLSFEDELPNGWILVNGEVISLNFAELTDADKAEDAVRRCKVNLNITGLIDQSEEISVDLKKASAEVEANIVFYDADVMESFFNHSTSEMILRLTPDDNGWTIVEFAAFEK